MKGVAWAEKRHGRPLPEGHENENDSPSYRLNQEIEASESSARHFINKGIAVEVSKLKAAPTKTSDEPELHDKPKASAK